MTPMRSGSISGREARYSRAPNTWGMFCCTVGWVWTVWPRANISISSVAMPALLSAAA
mgnify:CR=1 FL=1